MTEAKQEIKGYVTKERFREVARRVHWRMNDGCCRFCDEFCPPTLEDHKENCWYRGVVEEAQDD